MTNAGLVLLVSAGLFATVGVAGYVGARRSVSKSRCAALTLFGHGALGSSGVIALLLLFHVHRLWPLSVHVHSASETVAEILNCDIDAGCVALTILLLTGVVLLASFAVSQSSARLLLRKLRATEDRARSEALVLRSALSGGARVMVVRDDEADAFSFAILRGHRRRLLRAEDVIVLTSGLLGILTDDEADAVLAHEAAHVNARDDRYLPFFHIVSTLVFFDPVLRVLRRRLGRYHEFAADAESARETRRPLSLARALLKVYLRGLGGARPAGLFGRSRSELLARIEALLAMVESPTT